VKEVAATPTKKEPAAVCRSGWAVAQQLSFREAVPNRQQSAAAFVDVSRYKAVELVLRPVLGEEGGRQNDETKTALAMP
jgi:hypothetical protein